MKNIMIIGLITALFIGCNASQNKKVSTNNLLAISWQKSFCSLNRHKKECKNIQKNSFEANNFVLHGLWPQPRNKVSCKTKESGYLSKELFNKLKGVMPGVKSGLQKHEWKKHGTCYNTTVDRYFEDAMKVLQEINSAPLKTFFIKNQGKIITKQQLNVKFAKHSRKFSLVCKKGLIVELRFNLKGDISKNNLNTLLEAARPLKGGCSKGKIAGF